MALPTQLNATEQDTLVKQIGLSLLRAAPRDWRRVTAEYRAVGRYHELTGEIVLADGTTQEWVATHDIASLFGRLRTGMYREGRGTWFNARYQLDHPSSYNLEYDRDEPRWDLAPPPQAYADELRMFPRSEENVPDWLMRRMAGLGPERPGPRFRMARIFDGPGTGGRPVVNRPELDVEEQDRLLDYLDGAPVVVPGRGYDIDRVAPNPEGKVPIAFHSDGTWIWPAAVNYYLREYGIAPEPDLVQHIRANGFVIPDVGDGVRQAAAAHVSRGAPPPQQRPVPPPPPVPGPDPEADEADHEPRPSAEERRPQPPLTPQPPHQPPAPESDYDEHRPDEGQLAEHPFGEREFDEQPPEEHDAERTRIAAAPRFTEEQPYNDQGHSGQDYNDQDYNDQDYNDQGYNNQDYSDQHDYQEHNAERTQLAATPHFTEEQPYNDQDHSGQDYNGQDYNNRQDHEAQPYREHDAERTRIAAAPRFTEGRDYGAGSYADERYSEQSYQEPYDSERYEQPGRAPRVDPVETEQATTYTPVPVLDDGPPTTITPPQHAEHRPVETAVHRAAEAPEAPGSPPPTDEQPPPARDYDDDGGPPTEYSSGPLVFDEPVLDDLQDRLDEVGVPPAAYRIGEPAERGWALEEVPEGWRVGWYDGALTSPAVFGDVEDAAAFMLGKLLLAPEGAAQPMPPEQPRARRGALDEHSPPPPARPAPQTGQGQQAAQAEPAPMRPPVTTTLSSEVATGSRPPASTEASPADGARPTPPPAPPGGEPAGAGRRAQTPPAASARGDAPRPVSDAASGGQSPNGQSSQAGQGGKSNQQWPIQPLSGEPPLTLFRGKEMRDLPVGSELDRFGGPTGNLTYAAGTPFEERSLVPEWVNRPYHVYRVQRPVRALAGVAIPWFNQPGGGAAYLLPASIEELLAEGDLIELDPGEPPVD